ncbi:MAG: undecaprenyl-diphosphate phosphatase [Holophagae bacterium]
MSLGVAVVLGLLQGLTEFLPVSSSGHLALAQLVIPGFHQPGVLFDAMLHVGTAGAVVWYERRQIGRWLSTGSGRRLVALLLVGLAATAVVAFPIKAIAEAAFARPVWIGMALVATGVVVALTRWMPGGSDGERTMSWHQAVAIGLAQGAAVFPGLSRSGMTITAALASGLDRTWAARFSFLLGVPAILGVAALELLGERQALAAAGASYWAACAVGTVAAAVSGLVALHVVVAALSSRVFHRFAWYCLPVGVLVVLITWGRG